VELDLPIDTVEDMVRDLVGKNLFSGAINWKDGILYSKQASELKADRKCPNCGGQLELVGKGVIACRSAAPMSFWRLDVVKQLRCWVLEVRIR